MGGCYTSEASVFEKQEQKEKLSMSCYFRYMKDIFDEAGIIVNLTNKKQIDQAVHRIVGTDYKDCSGTWKAIKQNYLSDEKKRHELVQKLQAAIR